MPTQHDPEGIETKYLHNFADLAKGHILEIGCGDGRLTWRYATAAERVTGTDPDSQLLNMALYVRPPTLRSSLAFAQTKAEALPFPNQIFDTAILAWSL